MFRYKFSKLLKGEGGSIGFKSWMMENELECLGDRRGHDGHLAKKFLKKDHSQPELSRLPCHDLAVVTRQQLAI